jgi:hypothetical protein
MFHRNNHNKQHHHHHHLQHGCTSVTDESKTLMDTSMDTDDTSTSSSTCSNNSDSMIGRSCPFATANSATGSVATKTPRVVTLRGRRCVDEHSMEEKSMKYEKKHGRGIFISYRMACILLLLFVSVATIIGYTQTIPMNHLVISHDRSMINHSYNHPASSLYYLRKTHTHTVATSTDSKMECRWYLAESAIPHSGLGIYTGMPLQKDDFIGDPDICIFVSDGPKHWTHLRSHSFGRGSFFGQHEGKTNRAACEGLMTTVNTVPDAMVNMEIIGPILPTNAGLHRATSPGAGASSHHYGIHGKALTTIVAGSEITINYGDWNFNEQKSDNSRLEKASIYDRKPAREVSWLQQHGWCIDNIDIALSTIPHAGRGAFARVALTVNTVVAPAPLQVFADRKMFQTYTKHANAAEQLYVNYCFQPATTRMLLFPYGQGVNLINHSTRPNVELRWSKNTMHHNEY